MFKNILTFAALTFLLSFLFIPLSNAAEDQTYNFSWLDPDKEVYVLQNRKFRKAGRLHISAGAGITTSGPFVDSQTLQTRFGFFFKEEWGAEFIYAKNSGEENDTAALLRNEGGAGSVPFRRIVDNYMGGMILWSPFYTKINTFNKIIYLDLILGVGIAKLEETNNQEEFLTDGINLEETTQSHTGVMWNVGAKFFINERFSLRADLTTIHYQAEVASDTSNEKAWNENFDLALSLGVSF